MNDPQLDATIAACRQLITTRFPADQDAGAAAMLLEDGTILTGTAPETLNASVELCHETEPYCAAYRLQQRIIASVCLHRQASGRTVVSSPCGICRERLAIHGPDVLVAVADPKDPSTSNGRSSAQSCLTTGWWPFPRTSIHAGCRHPDLSAAK
ncbi:cytidine deaminase [Luteococcus japonicus]|uniref:cytidine deaminase n=1 Tax=Luteococcus japonicus TaxID=33984 RepID=UPI001C4E2E42|nr:cytidine deaminase [Luteococcus japonicus]